MYLYYDTFSYIYLSITSPHYNCHVLNFTIYLTSVVVIAQQQAVLYLPKDDCRKIALYIYETFQWNNKETVDNTF